MGFETIRLEEICEVKGGKRLPKGESLMAEKNKHPYLRIVDFVDGGIDDSNLMFVPDSIFEKIKRYTIDKGHIFLSIVGTIGVCGVVPDHLDGASLTENAVKIYPKKDVSLNSLFLMYYLISPVGQHQIKIRTVGSTQPKLAITRIKDIPVPMLDIKIQNQIVNVIHSFTEKIESNNNIIYNLEQLAQTLFKRWFVDFEFPNENVEPYKLSGGEMVESELGMIPEGWNPGKLSDIATLIMGQSPKSETYNEDCIGTPLINGASDFKKDRINPLKYTTDPKRVSQKGDFLFGVRATVGNVTYVDKEYALGRGVGVARANIDEYHEILYFQLINGIDYLKSTATGSVYISFTKNDIEGMRLVIPHSDMVKKFHLHTRDLFEQKKLLIKQNDALAILRDTLLPKLLSGEIEIEVTKNVPIS